MRGLQRVWMLALVSIVSVASTAAHAQFSVLYDFGSHSSDPYNPTNSGIVAQGRDGNLYSTAENGGTNGVGAVFNITPSGTLNVLYNFDGTHGSQPLGGLTLGTDGNFYGTTSSGGANGYGVIFRVTPSGSLSVLYSFANGTDGATPYAPPVQGTDGNWYGTTGAGGTNGVGTVYKLASSGKFTPLYQFDYTHGAEPRDPLVQGTDGNFYGTTLYGDASEIGVVFKITPAGKLTVLYNFDETHGANPIDPLIQGSDGNFYGTTLGGGTFSAGVVFKITPSGKLTVLYNMNGGSDGEGPEGGLVQATDGNFYGVNSVPQGGGNSGTLFKLTPKGSNFTVLHSFSGGSDGSSPQVTPFQHTNGVVYGDTNLGGTGNVNPCATDQCGVFYNWSNSLPTFVSLLPTLGKVGNTIGILGQGFSSSSVVKFDGVQATSVKNSGTAFLSATVPSGALTGSVTVTTGSTTLKSNKIFRVTPQLKTFSPTSGPVGTPVTITGVSLTQTMNVTFDGVKATTFTVNSDTQVTADVPTGAKTGHIAITTPGGTATSSGTFTVTQ